MKAEILSIDGKKAKDIELPEFFSSFVRADLISKFLEARKTRQPYSPSPVAGKQHAASGKVVHRRHVWRSGYGRGMSRVPRKIMTRKGSQFNWVGAEVSAMRGGRRAHPPKVIAMINTNKINKKETKMAFISALSATANKKQVSLKYQTIDEKDLMKLPLIVESKITKLKAKELLNSIKKIMGEKLFEISIRNKEVRSGKGKSRGRKYKINAGVLIVTGKDEKIKTTAFTVKAVQNLGISDLASGGPGRLTIYTEQAVKELGEKLK
jgi:large subunit ribosomal protein L4e